MVMMLGTASYVLGGGGDVRDDCSGVAVFVDDEADIHFPPGCCCLSTDIHTRC